MGSFCSAFGPIILLLYWKKLMYYGALLGMVTGATTAFILGKVPFLADALYEIVPGFFACIIVAVIVSMVTYKSNKEIEEEFDRRLALLEKEK